MKKWFIITASFFLAACNTDHKASLTGITTDTALIIPGKDSSTADADSITNTAHLIVPGECIGKTVLNSDAQDLESTFGKPDMSDAAMGKAWLTWYGKKKDEHNNRTELNIYTAYKDTDMRKQTVQQVRTNSSYFITSNGVRVYSSLDDIQKAFPNTHKAASYTTEGRRITIYDDKGQGIAFEISAAGEHNVCTGIIIHLKGEKVTDIYVTLHPDMKKL